MTRYRRRHDLALVVRGRSHRSCVSSSASTSWASSDLSGAEKEESAS